MSPDPAPDFDNWKDAWEYHAGQTRNAFLDLSEAELLGFVEREQIDIFFQLWHAIGERCRSEQAARVLRDYLASHTSEHDDLNRYHASEALWKILGRADPELEDPLRRACVVTKTSKTRRARAFVDLEKLIERRFVRRK